MIFLRRLFGKKSTPSNKPIRTDSPTNRIIKKVMFYGFLVFTTASIITKKYNTSLTFTFEPNQQNARIVDTVPIFHEGTYFPVYYMFYGPLQRIYAKYLQQAPYFRAKIQSADKDTYEIYELPVHDKYAQKKKDISLAILISGSQGIDTAMKKLMLSMNLNGFKIFCIKLDDFHNISRLHKTIQKIKSTNPQANTFGVGVQYGANLLVNYTADNQKTFDCIVSVGNPFDLEKAEKRLQGSFVWNKLLYKDVLKGRIDGCRNYKKLFGESLKINEENKQSLYEFDKLCYDIKNQNQNFKKQDYQTYKQRLSSVNSIKKLKIPALFIQSQQDPFSTPIQQIQQKIQNDKCIYVQTQRGGHLEWFQSMKKIRWVSRPISQYLKYFDGRLGFMV